MLVIELIVEVGEFIGVLLAVFLVGTIEDKPLSEFEHGGETLHISAEG